MKAVVNSGPAAIAEPQALADAEVAAPVALERDLVVRVKAISVNPVDTKVRQRPLAAPGPRILGWDAVGVVESVGGGVRNFKAGDRVYYAGSIARPGTNAELHAIDERLAALAPRSLDDAQAAALPLTALTAWELLFDRLEVAPRGRGQAGSLLVVGGAGGVGSILIQLARRLTNLRVIATASRPETRQWCLDLGAHAVVDHARPLAQELLAQKLGQPEYVAALTQTDQHFDEIVQLIKPQGKLGIIDDPAALDVTKLKSKSLSLHWEFMFARSLHQTEDMARQGAILAEVADLVDAGVLRTTASASLGAINAANLRKAHELIESGRAKGKIVLEGF